MKISGARLFLYIFSSVLLLVFIGLVFVGMVFTNILKGRVDDSTNINMESNKIDIVNSNHEIPLHQLEDIAQGIIRGTVLSSSYGYDNGMKIIEFKITDINGVTRELVLDVSNGKVYDIDYDYDEQGNKFINQLYFDVNITFEQAKDIAISNVKGNILAYRQSVYKGLFIYDFVIQDSNEILYEVHVETKNGTILKVKTLENYSYDDYIIIPVDTPNTNNEGSGDGNDEPVQQEIQNPVLQQNENSMQQNQSSSYKSEEELRQIVLSAVPGIVEYYYKDWDDGVLEYKYMVRTRSNMLVEVEINAYGWITDIDYED